MLNLLKSAARHVLPPNAQYAIKDARLRLRDPRIQTLATSIAPESPLNLFVVGARGELPEAARYLRRRGCLRSIGFEPEPKEAARLARCGLWDAVVPTALGDARARKQLHQTRNPGCSSIFRPAGGNVARFCDCPEWFEVVGQSEIEIERLADVIEDQRLPEPDILCVDTQGFDLAVLKGTGRYLDQVQAIALEVQFVPLYEGQPLFGEIHSWLESRGFYLCYLRPNGAFRGYLVECDACYCRSPEQLAEPKAWQACEFLRVLHRFGR